MKEIKEEELVDMDPFLGVHVLDSTQVPQTCGWYGLRQCYAPFPVKYIDDPNFPKSPPDEEECGSKAIDKLLSGGKGHFSPLEHSCIVLNIYGFPHNAVQQLRTHRTGVGFSVQSGRYCGDQFKDAALSVSTLSRLFGVDSSNDDTSRPYKKAVEEQFFIPPCGIYRSRGGEKYEFTEERRLRLIDECYESAKKYKNEIDDGAPEERARSYLKWDIVRQHLVFSCNARSLMHILDMRGKDDAQVEIRALALLLFRVFQWWMPEIANYYYKKRWKKAKLSP